MCGTPRQKRTARVMKGAVRAAGQHEGRAGRKRKRLTTERSEIASERDTLLGRWAGEKNPSASRDSLCGLFCG